MSGLKRLRRAQEHARRNGWERHHASGGMMRTWPIGGRVRMITAVPRGFPFGRTDEILSVLEFDKASHFADATPRRVSIRRAIKVLTAEYDDRGDPIA